MKLKQFGFIIIVVELWYCILDCGFICGKQIKQWNYLPLMRKEQKMMPLFFHIHKCFIRMAYNIHHMGLSCFIGFWRTMIYDTMRVMSLHSHSKNVIRTYLTWFKDICRNAFDYIKNCVALPCQSNTQIHTHMHTHAITAGFSFKEAAC